MKPIIKGIIEPILTGSQVNFDPAKGLTSTEDWESAGDNLGGMAVQARLNGNSYTLRANGRKSRLTITSSSGTAAGVPDVTLDSWQLLGNEIQKDIKEHPNVLALPVVPSLSSLSNVLKQVKLHDEGKPITAVTGAALVLYNLLIHGVTSYTLGQYVLKHTTSVSDAYNTNVADLGVEKVYSTGQLVSEISNAGYWTKPCPGRLIAKIQRMEVNGPNDGDLFRWGWKKNPSTETSSANNRIEISTEYVLASWPLFLYSAL